MKKTNIKYQVIRQIIALVKMSLPIALLWQTGAMLIFWVCKKLCKGTPVLIARNRTIFDDSQNEGSQATFERDMRGHKVFGFRNAAKSLAVAAAMPLVSVPIQEVQLLDYAVAHETVNSTYGLTASNDDDIYLGLLDKDPYTSDQQRTRDQYELNDTDWNEVVFEDDRLFRQESSDNTGYSSCKMALHTDWIKKKGYYVGAVVNLDLPEQGISGPFKITSIKHIIPQKKPVDEDETDDYGYKPVTALFNHQSDAVYNITFASDKNSSETIGVTYQHPIFSVTAGDWRLAGEFEVGEKVLTKEGEATVTNTEKKGGSELVYNLEVKDFHNFLVGNEGVVVHNSCWDMAKKVVSGAISKAEIWAMKGYPAIFKRGNIIEQIIRKGKYTKGKGWGYTGVGDGGLGKSNFWLIDFFKGNRVVSLKSTVVRNGSDWATSNAQHIRDLSTRKILGKFPNCKPGPNCINPSHVIDNITEAELHIVVEKLSDINKNDWITAIKSKLPIGEKDNIIITITEL